MDRVLVFREHELFREIERDGALAAERWSPASSARSRTTR